MTSEHFSGQPAGLLYGYAVSVNPGLNRLSDEAYLSAMQSINRAIMNPVFLANFVGAPVLLVGATWLHYQSPLTGLGWLVTGATVVYLMGVVGITAFGNIPLNNSLAAFDIPSATASQLADMRNRFEIPWNRFHTIRTVASILATALLIGALLSGKG